MRQLGVSRPGDRRDGHRQARAAGADGDGFR